MIIAGRGPFRRNEEMKHASNSRSRWIVRSSGQREPGRRLLLQWAGIGTRRGLPASRSYLEPW